MKTEKRSISKKEFEDLAKEFGLYVRGNQAHFFYENIAESFRNYDLFIDDAIYGSSLTGSGHIIVFHSQMNKRIWYTKITESLKKEIRARIKEFITIYENAKNRIKEQRLRLIEELDETK